jgi:hypothetical protein
MWLRQLPRHGADLRKADNDLVVTPAILDFNGGRGTARWRNQAFA